MEEESARIGIMEKGVDAKVVHQSSYRFVAELRISKEAREAVF